MTRPKLRTIPSLIKLKEFKEGKSREIYIESTLIRGKRGKRGLLIESVWQVNYDTRSIHLTTTNLISHVEKTPLTPFDIPDRHLRSARRIGAALFDLKRFDNLILFEITDSPTVYSATRNEETRLFTELSDATLWSVQKREECTIKKRSVTKKSTSKSALRNSASIRADMLKLMLQAVTGLSAIERIRTLLERGADLKDLEKIWRDTHGGDIIPDVLRTILYEKEK